MKRSFPAISAIVLCILAMQGAAFAQTAQTAPTVQTPKPAVTPGVPKTEAQLAWERDHAEWQKRYGEWEKRYHKWVEEQARLDDGFLLSIGLGPSPTRVDTRFSGGDKIGFPSVAPYPDISQRGIGASFDLRMGWLVENDPFLKDYWYGNDELHDQLYLSVDVLTRSTFSPQWRFKEDADTASNLNFLQPDFMLDVMVGVGMTYLVYPYRTSISTTVGFGLIGLQSDTTGVRTSIGPAFNMRIGQEWAIRENWRSGFAVNYGVILSTNPSQVDINGTRSYQENYTSYLFSIQWINSFTPPKYRRGVPPPRPQERLQGAPAR